MQKQAPAVETDDRLSALEEREAKIARKEAEQTLHSAHPDFADIRKSDEFHSWAKSQPEAIQDWVYNNPDNVDLAVKAIDLYKLESGIQVSQVLQQQSQTSTKASAADMVSTKQLLLMLKKQKFGHNGKLLPCLWLSTISMKKKLTQPLWKAEQQLNLHYCL